VTSFGEHDLKKLAAIAPGCTLNLVRDHRVVKKYRLSMPPRIYGFDETYTETYVVRVNPETGEMTRLGDMQDRNYKFFAMACSPKGELFCTYLNKQTNDVYLGRIRKSDGKVAMIRGINATNLLPGDSFINSTYDQAMFARKLYILSSWKELSSII
jgi:hypothetical protein